ncbi:hypothetical protein Dimus_015929, partial [Dionaea muscipula]
MILLLSFPCFKLQALDNDGIAAEKVSSDDILLYKQTPTITRGNPVEKLSNSQYKPTLLKHSGPLETAVVERVIFCSDINNNMTIKFMIRETRRPEFGDKFSSQHGQKGVCGTIVQQEDFAFTEHGICPDLIMNPHGFP